MKKLIIALVVLAVVGTGTYYLVFNNGSNRTPTYTPPATNNLNTSAPTPTAQPSNTPTPTVSVSNVPKATAVPGVTVDIKNFSFNPPTLTIKTGTKVTWVNNDSTSHTVTSDSGNLLNSSAISPGQSFSFTFTDPGTISYHCSIHTIMKGSIVVTH